MKENPSLRVLGLRNRELHKNYYVESYGGMTSVWYDDVKLGEHMNILSRFSNLEELYLDGSELADLNFAAGLKNLKRLGLKDYYITDLGPLKQAEFLEYPDIRDNLWAKWVTWVTEWKLFSNHDIAIFLIITKYLSVYLKNRDNMIYWTKKNSGKDVR